MTFDDIMKLLSDAKRVIDEIYVAFKRRECEAKIIRLMKELERIKNRLETAR